MAVLDAGGTGGFTGATGQTTVKMLEYFRVGWFAFEKLLHLVDAAARPVKLIATQLVGWAGRVTKAAMHTLAQDRFYFRRMFTLLDFCCETGLHDYKPG
jgi:hypothetical protein